MAFKDNKKFYEKSILAYGISAQGVHWSSHISQYIRFEILTNFIRKEIPTSSIVDAGCGMGEYYNYLTNQHLKPKEYLGIDCEEKMIDISKFRYPNVHFEKLNILNDKLKSYDYYICSGAMNILTKDEFYLFIKQCYENCKKGFAFNFLKSRSYNQIKIEDVLEFCNKLTSNIRTVDGYLDNDYSIFLIKENNVF